MISIIICSTNIDRYDKLKNNVQQTIGIEHEIIRINNNQNIYGICEAYNIGASKARYELLCFIHEDVSFLNTDWGKILLYYFQNKEVGLLGIAGSQYKTKTVGGWWNSGPLVKIKMRQGSKNSNAFQDINKEASGCESCVCIDGIFMATPQKVWKETLFDNKTLKKFHCYDLDYSLSVFEKGYKVLVCYDIFLEHFSTGEYNRVWYDETLKFHRKWQSKLPISIDNISRKEKIEVEWNTKKNMLGFLVSNDYPLSELLKNIFSKMYSFSLKKCIICIIEIYKLKKQYSRSN
jgi:GT2 family glycosyltransferase